ncbi:MAG: rhodanese-like domain-containing protein [Candidatus Poribacteria bacterium]|nr:rhodanese-like domain-containing protein [Candidatus Poribacteria bacterium]MDE0503689.1 rhodanese-like domain-containing protein [Candidatus Poribacteria bacterium]
MKRLNRNLTVLIAGIFLCLLPLSRILGFAAEPERIQPPELKRLLDSGAKVVVVDVRSEREFREAHIPDALSIPLAQLEMRHTELPKEGLIAFY